MIFQIVSDSLLSLAPLMGRYDFSVLIRAFLDIQSTWLNFWKTWRDFQTEGQCRFGKSMQKVKVKKN